MNDGAPAQLSGREVWPSRNVRLTFPLNWQLSVSDACLHLASNQRVSVKKEKAPLTLMSTHLLGRRGRASSWTPSQLCSASKSPRPIPGASNSCTLPDQGIHFVLAINQTFTTNSQPQQILASPGLQSTGCVLRPQHESLQFPLFLVKLDGKKSGVQAFKI